MSLGGDSGRNLPAIAAVVLYFSLGEPELGVMEMKGVVLKQCLPTRILSDYLFTWGRCELGWMEIWRVLFSSSHP